EIVNAITRKWIITNVDGIDDNKKYVVTIVRRESNSNLAKVSVIAKEKQIDDLKARIIYQNITGHYTAKEYFDLIF
ncbi:tail tube TT1 domain-containing protein, partial [Staphylococcus argensis]